MIISIVIIIQCNKRNLRNFKAGLSKNPSGAYQQHWILSKLESRNQIETWNFECRQAQICFVDVARCLAVDTNKFSKKKKVCVLVWTNSNSFKLYRR